MACVEQKPNSPSFQNHLPTDKWGYYDPHLSNNQKNSKNHAKTLRLLSQFSLVIEPIEMR